MTLRTFRANTMSEALEKVQAELGPDALVISARSVPGGSAWQVWRQPEVEIVATLPETKPSQPAPVVQTPRTAPKVEAAPEEKAPDMPKEQRWQPQRITRAQAYAQADAAVTPTPAAPVTPAAIQPDRNPETTQLFVDGLRSAMQDASELPNSLRPLQQSLLAQELEPAWVERLLKLAAATLPGGMALDNDSCRAFLRRQMEAELKAAPPDNSLPMQRVIVVVGANGSGKTSLIARLARHYSQNQHANVQWVCADNTRAAAIAEARTYTQALNLPLSLVYTPDDWDKILNNPADLILVDTPGINPWDERQILELGELLPPTTSRLVYLAISATTKLKDALQSAAMLKIFGLNGLAITRMEETRSYGTIFDLARRSRLPLSLFTSSKEISRGMEFAQRGHLIDALLGKDWEA
jgi:flagellar biosynthesis protein FlhF